MSLFVENMERQQNSFYALGGIGTGFVKLYPNGLVCACENQKTEGISPSFFVIKTKEKNGKISVKALCDENVSQDFSGFDKSGMAARFPFVNKTFECEEFPAKVTLEAFSPFLPLNDTDSSIPVAYFDYTVENLSNAEIQISLCAVVQSLFDNGHNNVGCSENGTAFVCLQENDNTSLCIATDEKNVSYKETLVLDKFAEEFKNSDMLVNDKMGLEQKQPTAALCTHFTLEKGQTKTVKFAFTWHFSHTSSGRKTYYSQYFAGSDECASYCFLHRNRLKSETQKFTETLFGSTFPKIVFKHINEFFENTRKLEVVRLEDGTLAKTKQDKTYSDNAYALRYLFPKMSKLVLLKKIASILEKDGLASTQSICVCIIKFYRDYTLDADYEQLIENWYYIAKLAQGLYSDDKKEYTHLEKAALYLFCKLAQQVKDRKRFNEYTKKHENMIVNDNSLTNYALLHIDECGLFDLYKEFEPVDESENVYASASVLMRRHKTQQAITMLEKKEKGADMLCAYSLLNAINGFEYDANTAEICFNPVKAFEQDGTYRGFFCIDTGYGYVERGIDYIEINMVFGSVNVKNFKVPKLPRMVLYGGRNWKFVANKNVAELDSTLKITPDKKLTVIIDV